MKIQSVAMLSVIFALAACDSDSDGGSSKTTPDASADDDSDVGETDDDGDDEVETDDDVTAGDDDDATDDDATDDDATDDDAQSGDDDATDDDAQPGDDDIDAGADADGDDDTVASDDDTGDLSPEAGTPLELTYYGDALAVFEERCLGCHQEGGIAPFRLDDYEAAAEHADEAKTYVQARVMPPYLLTSGEGCGDFEDSKYLSQEEIDIIAGWADGGALEGEPREVNLPPLPTLEATETISSPVFTPEPGGGELAEFDEYRCFLIDRRTAGEYEFLTGYDVHPGIPEIVHHVTVSLVTEDGPSGVENPDTGMPYTNGELIALLDGESPDRDGWPCYSGAGDGVEFSQLPIVWAPGQGAIRFPNESGTYITPADMMVMQVHYNLHDDEFVGQPDQTTVELSTASVVTNVGFSFVVDPLLRSLLSGDTPESLEPGNPDVQVSWELAVGDTPVGIFPNLELWGIFPHMHELGRDYSFSANVGGADACLADMTHWDFHWQLNYYYQQGIPLSPEDTLAATCHYDTTSKTEPVLPGWGTQNEMCFTGLYFTAPVLAVLEALGQ